MSDDGGANRPAGEVRNASDARDARPRGPYLLFCLRSGNAMTDFASEREAWNDLCDWAQNDGLEAIEELALSRIGNDDMTVVAMDDDLVRRVARELRQAPMANGSRP